MVTLGRGRRGASDRSSVQVLQRDCSGEAQDKHRVEYSEAICQWTMTLSYLQQIIEAF